MAHVTMKAGATFDVLTPEEHRQRLERVMSDFQDWQRQSEGETITRSAGPFLTDATGGTSTLARGGGAVYRVPTGYDGILTRLSVDYEGSNASSTVSCDLRVVADFNSPAALRAIYNAVPAVYEASKSHAALFRGGQEIVVSLTGGPHSTAMYVTVQVLLVKRTHLSADVLDGA